MAIKLQFISNNLKELQKSLERIKIFEYLKNNLSSKACLF